MVGKLPTEADRKHATIVANGVPGVTQVKNKIKVNPNVRPSSALPPDPPMGFGRGGANGQVLHPAPPQDLLTELQARLQAHPKMGGVTVYISGRKAVFRGNVASKAAQNEAGELVRAALPKWYKLSNHVAIN